MTNKPTPPAIRALLPDDAQLVQRIFRLTPEQAYVAFGVMRPFALHTPGQTQDACDSAWEDVAGALGKDMTLDEGLPKPRGEWLAALPGPAPAARANVYVTIGPLEKPRTSLRPPRGAENAPPGFGPLPADHPQRTRYLGSFDAHWMQTHWPEFPEGTDSRFFLTAPEDQWLDGFWQGGEAIRLQPLDHAGSELFGTVPGQRPRFFVHQTREDGNPDFLELKVNTDTVWLLPSEHLGVIIYRALLPIHSPDARDVQVFFADFEAPDAAQQPLEYYLNRSLRALAPEAFRDEPDLLPPDGTTPDTAQLLAHVRKHRQQFQALLEKNAMDEAGAMAELLANPYTRKLAQGIEQHGGSISGFFNGIETILEELAREEGTPTTEPAPARARQPDLRAAVPPPLQTAPQAPQSAPAGPSAGAALRDEALAARHRQQVLQRLRAGQSCKGLDLSQANLAGLDLPGMDLSGAILAGANLAGAQLVGANLHGALLQGARLDGANLTGCRLDDASLQDASLLSARLTGASLNGSDCTAANFSGTDLTGIQAQRASFSRAWLSQVAAARLQAEAADFSHANLEGADLRHANLKAARFLGARATDACLDEANCASASFAQADMRRVSAVHCRLDDSESTEGTQWQGARLERAHLDGASWMGAELAQVSLAGASAQAADFSYTVLDDARLEHANLRAAVFDRARLTGARCSHSNLMEASFVDADLQRCALDDTNLYAADFTRTQLDGARLDGALLDATLLQARANP